jgi:hypothetical protein
MVAPPQRSAVVLKLPPVSWQEIARQCGLKVIDGKVHS